VTRGAAPGGAEPRRGRVVVVTGASAGIGAAAATMLSRGGAHVAVVGRSAEKTRGVARRCDGTPFVCDFARLAEVRRVADELSASFTRIDVLANNAGLYVRRREITADGHELTFQVNHLAPFLLTNLLAERLRGHGTVVTTSSRAQLLGGIDREDLGAPRRYHALRAYATTKLENVLFTKELARRWSGHAVAAAAFHPGSVRSEFGRRGGLAIGLVYRTPLGRVVLRSPEVGADTLCWLATSEAGASWESGGYYANRRPARAHRSADDERLAAWLWERSEELVGIA